MSLPAFAVIDSGSVQGQPLGAAIQANRSRVAAGSTWYHHVAWRGMRCFQGMRMPPEVEQQHSRCSAQRTQ